MLFHKTPAPDRGLFLPGVRPGSDAPFMTVTFFQPFASRTRAASYPLSEILQEQTVSRSLSWGSSPRRLRRAPKENERLSDAVAVVAKEREVRRVLNSLKSRPRLVICDSQVAQQVARDIPDDIELTTFSIMFPLGEKYLEDPALIIDDQ